MYLIYIDAVVDTWLTVGYECVMCQMYS